MSPVTRVAHHNRKKGDIEGATQQSQEQSMPLETLDIRQQRNPSYAIEQRCIKQAAHRHDLLNTNEGSQVVQKINWDYEFIAMAKKRHYHT